MDVEDRTGVLGPALEEVRDPLETLSEKEQKHKVENGQQQKPRPQLGASPGKEDKERNLDRPGNDEREPPVAVRADAGPGHGGDSGHRDEGHGVARHDVNPEWPGKAEEDRQAPRPDGEYGNQVEDRPDAEAGGDCRAKRQKGDRRVAPLPVRTVQSLAGDQSIERVRVLLEVWRHADLWRL